MRKRLLTGAAGVAFVLVALGTAAPAYAQSRTTVADEQSAKTADSWTCQAAYDEVRIRRYPNTSKKSTIINTIPKGGRATCKGKWLGNSKSAYSACGRTDTAWTYVKYKKDEGWVADWCLDY